MSFSPTFDLALVFSTKLLVFSVGAVLLSLLVCLCFWHHWKPPRWPRWHCDYNCYRSLGCRECFEATKDGPCTRRSELGYSCCCCYYLSRLKNQSSSSRMFRSCPFQWRLLGLMDGYIELLETTEDDDNNNIMIYIIIDFWYFENLVFFRKKSSSCFYAVFTAVPVEMVRCCCWWCLLVLVGAASVWNDTILP
jgi:hypothetical protein